MCAIANNANAKTPPAEARATDPRDPYRIQRDLKTGAWIVKQAPGWTHVHRAVSLECCATYLINNWRDCDLTKVPVLTDCWPWKSLAEHLAAKNVGAASAPRPSALACGCPSATIRTTIELEGLEGVESAQGYTCPCGRCFYPEPKASNARMSDGAERRSFPSDGSAAE